MAKDRKFDDIFAPTGAATTRKAPARKRPESATPAAAATPVPPADDPCLDRDDALLAALTAHHGEVLQRKAREDRFLFWSTGLTAALVVVALLVFRGAPEGSWLARLVLKLVLAAGAVANLLFTTTLMENNRKKTRDLMGVVVKLNERLGFFTPGIYDASEEPFYPNAYKFAGSEAEDETNVKALFLKGMAGFAVLVIVLLA
jgi:hypothetical protein